MKQPKKHKFGILSAYGHLWVETANKSLAEQQFAKNYDLEKYPVKKL